MNTKELRKLAEEAETEIGLYTEKVSHYDKINIEQWKEKVTAENRKKEKERYTKRMIDWEEECKKIKEEQKWWKEREAKPREPFDLFFDMRIKDYSISRYYLGNKRDEVGETSFWYKPLSQEILQKLISAQKSHQFKRFEIWKIKEIEDSPIIMVGFSAWINPWGYYEDPHWFEDKVNKFVYKIYEGKLEDKE